MKITFCSRISAHLELWLETVACVCVDGEKCEELWLKFRPAEFPSSVYSLCTLYARPFSERQLLCTFLSHRKSVSFQVNRSWTNTSSVTCSHPNSSCSMFVCSHEHFQRHLKPFCFWGSCCLLPNTCFNAVNTQSGHVSFVCVCVYITLYANAAFVQPNAFKYNNTVVLDHVRTWMSTEFQTYLRHLKWYALI